MATEGRPEDLAVKYSAVEDFLREDSCSFEFFQAVRLLEHLDGDRQPVGLFSDPDREVVRFQVNSSLGFPPSQIRGIRWTEGRAPRMIVNFMGLTGPMGVLPYCFSELIIERVRAKDTSLQAFLDIFNHRAISFFYRAWEKYRFPVAYERGERDQFSHHLLDLMGLGTEGLQNRQRLLDDSLVYYCGLLAAQPKSAAALEQVLNDYFDVPVEIDQFAGAWYKLDSDSQCDLDDAAASISGQLGVGAVVGDEIWDQQSRVRIKIGPLGLHQYQDFLPEGTAFEPLRALVRFLTNDEFEFEVQLIMKKEEVPPCELGAEGDAAPRLGWVTWMKSKPLGSDPGETLLKL
ncbi:MAG: type VI secretion system baseplate subunit TssG [Candidatus Dormibacteraceae bacterium]